MLGIPPKSPNADDFPSQTAERAWGLSLQHLFQKDHHHSLEAQSKAFLHWFPIQELGKDRLGSLSTHSL